VQPRVPTSMPTPPPARPRYRPHSFESSANTPPSRGEGAGGITPSKGEPSVSSGSTPPSRGVEGGTPHQPHNWEPSVSSPPQVDIAAPSARRPLSINLSAPSRGEDLSPPSSPTQV